MSASDEQFGFGKDFAKLMLYIVSEGDKFTLGGTARPQQIQNLYFFGYRVVFDVDEKNKILIREPGVVKCPRKSKKRYSYHGKKVAGDLNMFKFIELQGHFRTDLSDEEKKVYKYITNPLEHKKAFQKYGDYWESLNPKNRWGGNWAKIVVINGKEGLVGFYDGPHFERRK